MRFGTTGPSTRGPLATGPFATGPFATGLVASGVVATVVGALLLGTGGVQAAEGFLTFRDFEGKIIEHHSSPQGCFAVPRESLAEAAFADGAAILIHGRDCEGEEIGELGRDPIRVLPHESVLIREG